MKKIDLKLNYNAIRERIDFEKRKYRPGEWAKNLDVSLNTISNIHGKTKINPSPEYIIKVARKTGKSIEFFLYGEEWMPPFGLPEKTQKLNVSYKSENNYMTISESEMYSEDIVSIPQIETFLSRDTKEPIIIKTKKTCYFTKKFIEEIASDIKKTAIMIVRGDSMSPTLMDGDEIMIDLDRKNIAEGKLHAFYCNEIGCHIFIKRLVFFEEKIKIISDNRDYDSYFVDPGSLNIIGQVIWGGHRF